MFQESFKGVSWKFQGRSKRVSRVFRVFSWFQVYLKIIERVFEGSFNGVSRKFQGSFKED